MDGVNIPGGPAFIGLPQPPDVPCDPTGDGWRGPEGPQGPTGPVGPVGPSGAGGISMGSSGAVGDGITDDQPVIQAWLNSLAAIYTGAEIQMPVDKWYYIHAAPLVIPPHIVIRGTYNTRDNQTAGGSFLACGGFYIDPALPAGIILCASSSLRNVKVYRYGMAAHMTDPANLSAAIANYTAWAAEGVYRKVTGLHASTDTVIPMANTAGISVGMTVTGIATLVPAIDGTWASRATVTAINPNVSVTLSAPIGAATTSRAGRWLRFGSSIGVMLARNSGFITIDDCCIVGFRTGIQTTTGQYSIKRCVGDSITNVEITGGGSVGWIQDCHWLPLYGAPPSALTGAFVRAGDMVFVHDSVGTLLVSCYGIGWQTGFHLENAAVQATDCFNEMPRGAGPNSENWVIRGGSAITLKGCYAQAGSIGFHLDAVNNFLMTDCVSQGSQLTLGDNIAHVYVENVRQLIPSGALTNLFGHMAGSIVGLKTFGGYYSDDPATPGVDYVPNKVPVVFNQTTDPTGNGADGKGLISGCQLLGHYIQDISNPPVAPWISGPMPYSEVPAFQQGVVYPPTLRVTGGYTVALAYQSGVIFDGAGTLATHTIELPPFPVDGQTFDVWFNVAVTTLTFASASQRTTPPPIGSVPVTATYTPQLIGAYNNPSAGQHIRAIYELATNTWYFGGGTASVIATGGTASRTLADHFGDMLSILDLGAVGDGVADDTAAFAAAALKPTGTTIYLPANHTFLITAQQYNHSNRCVSYIGGDRNTTIIRLKPSSPAMTTALFFWNNPTRSGPTVKNFTIDINSTAWTTYGTGIIAINVAQNAEVSDMSIINMGSQALAIGGVNWAGGVIRNNYVQLLAGDSTTQSKALSLGVFGTGANVGVRVLNNTFVNTNVLVTAAQRCLFEGNEISGWGVGGGITLGWNAADTVWSFENTVVNNKVHDSLSALDIFGVAPNGLELWTDRSIIASNHCWNCAASGIAVGGKSCLVSGNTTYDNNTHLIANLAGIGAVYSTTNHNGGFTTFIGNRSYDSGVGRQYYGCSVQNLVASVTLTSNDFSGPSGPYLFQGPTPVINPFPDAIFGKQTAGLPADTTGHIYLPFVAGAPTAVPAWVGAGISVRYDTTNKKLWAYDNVDNAWRSTSFTGSGLRYQTTTTVGNGADLTTDVLQSYTLPANTLVNVGDRLIIRAAGNYIGSTDTKLAQVFVGGGGTQINLTGNTASNVVWRIEGEVLKTGPNAQSTSFAGWTNINVATTSNSQITRTDTAPIVITIQGQNSTNPVASSITCRYFTVDYVAAA